MKQLLLALLIATCLQAQTHTITTEVFPPLPPPLERTGGQLKAFCVAADGQGRRLSITISNLDAEPVTIGKGPMLCLAAQDDAGLPPKITCSVDGTVTCIPWHECPADDQVCAPE